MADNYDDLRRITIDDVPEEYHELVDVIGLDVFLELCRFVGGSQFYLPAIKSIELAGRNREIQSRFNGGNYKQLAAMFRLSDRQVRKIVDKKEGGVNGKSAM